MVWSTVFTTPKLNAKPCCVSSSLVPPNSTIIVSISSLSKTSELYSVCLHYVNEERSSVDLLANVHFALKENPVAFTFDSSNGRITTLGQSNSQVTR